jgi:Papain-like cysteine protease AvrRpt2
MTVKLAVPLVAQQESMSCWYAGACMVTYYREAGPRLGIPRAYQFNTGIFPFQFGVLARNEGLKPVTISQGATAEQLEVLLNKHGPLWCDGDWFGAKHIIVLTGVDTSANEVFFNDPDGGVAKQNSVTWFNQHLSRLVDGVLYYPPKA